MKKLIVLLLVVCLSSGVANATMRKGPYLIYPDDNTEMMVLWQLTAERTCTLEWGEDTSYSSGSVQTTEYSGGTDGHQHKYTITGLTPGTKYYYQVIEDANQTGTFYAAPPESADSVKFLALGDTLAQGNEFDTVSTGMIDVYEADPDYQTLALHMGDAAWDGWTEAGWDGRYFDRSRPNAIELQANLPVNMAIGNHEVNEVAPLPLTLFDKYFPYPYPAYAAPDANFFWSFDYGPAHFAIVDEYTYDYPLGTIQTAWLENDLATTDKEWKFIYFHESAYSAGRNDDHWPTRDAIQPLAERYGVDIVFQGHNHYYARCVKNGVTYITTGGGGQQPLFDPNANYSPYVVTIAKVQNFCKIAIDGKQLELTAVEPNGAVVESFTLDHRCYVPTLPWSDGFEDANSYESDDIGGGWDISDSSFVVVQSGDVNSGTYAAQIENVHWVRRAISTRGFSDIHVKYARKTTDLDAGEYLNVEWSVDNTNWTNLESTQDTTWTSVDMTCDANANNSPGFRVRFHSNGGTAEYAYVDDVEITGTPIYATGDFDGTGSVGFYDLDLLIDHWLLSCSGPGCCDECDIDGGGDVEFVDFAYVAGDWSPDTTAPTPDPMTWDTVPYATATGESSIAMVATTASDGSGVQYYFDCTTAGGTDSGWQGSSSYEDTGLSPSTSYTYQVKARDRSPNRNQTAFSTTESATTDPLHITPPEPNVMTWDTVPYATGDSSIAMVATTASDPYGVEYYFEEISDNNGATDSGWRDSPSYMDGGLDPCTTYIYKVKARDKSISQNETAFSTAESATTEAPGPTLLFSDKFPVYGDFTTGGWTTGGDSTNVNSQCACEGGNGAQLKTSSWMEKALSTVGYTDIQVKYVRKTNTYDAGEYLTVEWSADGGSTWETPPLEQTNVTDCGYVTWTCGSGANNNANWKVKFSTNASAANEYACVDDVEIWGAPQ